jgi:hypothetical protein
MNDLDEVTTKICSAREMIDIVSESIQNRDYDRAEAMANAAYEFLGYYLEEFDVNFKKAWKETVLAEREYYEGKIDDGMRPWGHSDLEYQITNNKKYEYTATGEKFPLSCDKDDPSPECQGAWNDFWEENYYPEEHHTSLSKEIEAIRAAGGYEWTPDPEVSRNDPTRLKYEGGWIYESPDGGKTVTKRKVGSTEKFVVKEDKVKKWVLPVEEVRDEDTDEDIYCVTFPDDLLEAANLKEGDEIEWVEKGDGSYLLRKVIRPLGMDEC